jgi:hypothetical protein
MLKAHPSRAALAIVFMLLFIAAFAAYAWASTRARAIVGPSHLAAGVDVVYVHAGDELIALSPGGALRWRHPAAGLGLDDMPIDLRVLDDGRLLLAQQWPARLRTCTAEGMDCAALGDIAAHFEDQYKVFPEPDGRLLVADFASGRLWRLATERGVPQALTRAGALRCVNDLLPDDTGRIWIADAGNFRIAVLKETVRAGWRVERSLAAANAHSRPGNDWPMMLAWGGDGNLWVVQTSRTGGSADVLVYDPARGAIARIDLPPDAWPADIVRAGDAMIVSDMERFRLYRIDTATRAVGEFGDAEISALLRGRAEARDVHESRMPLALGAMGVFAVLMIGAAVWATPKGQRLTQHARAAPLAAAAAAVPATNGIYWLRRDPKTDRFLTQARLAMYVVPFLLICTFLLAIYLLEPAVAGTENAEKLVEFENFKRTMLYIAAVVGSLPFLLHFPFRNMRATLGTDGRRVYARYADGTQLAWLPQQLVYGARQIVHEDRELSIMTGKLQPLYADGEIETYIAPLLQRATKLGAFDLTLYKLRHREPALIASWVLIAAMIAAVVVTGAWRQLLS